jgi:hypothetical protein
MSMPAHRWGPTGADVQGKRQASSNDAALELLSSSLSPAATLGIWRCFEGQSWMRIGGGVGTRVFPLEIANVAALGP